MVSPTKLLSRKTSSVIKSSNIVTSQNMKNNNSPQLQQTKRQRSPSPKCDPKLKKQDTSKWCNKCSKNFLASKYEAHVILKHLNQLAMSELKQEQSLVSCHSLQCPDQACWQSSRFINIESLLVHFITKHSKLLQSKHAATIISNNSKDIEKATKDVNSKSKISSKDDLLDISDDGVMLSVKSEVKSKSPPVSQWMNKFKTYCYANPEGQVVVESDFTTVSPVLMEKFLTHLCQTPSVIPQLEEVITVLATIFSKVSLRTLPTVVRHLLLLDYQKHCTTVGTSMQVCNPMQVVILFSQLLAKPGVRPDDLDWLVRWVSKMHDKVDGRLLIENKKITDFFEAVGYKLEASPSEEEKVPVNVKQEVVERESFPCLKCGTKFNKRIGLVRHRERCGVEQVRAGAGQAGAGQEVRAGAGQAVASSIDPPTEKEDHKQVAARFKAKRLSLGLTQKQVLVNMKNLLGPELKVQTIDVAKFELNHNQQSMAKFLPLAKAWLEGKATAQSTDSAPVQVKAEPALPAAPAQGSLQAEKVSLPSVSSLPTQKYPAVSATVPRVDIVKLKLSPTDFTASINLATTTDVVQEPREREKLAIPTVEVAAPVKETETADPDIAEAEPECIDLDEEDKVYRYFCLECEGCVGSTNCDHTSHPRVPLQFDISTHIARTGHVAVSPITGFLSMSPITDLAYSFHHGADVRKQWKDLVLAGSYIPSQFTGVKRCKWAGCKEVFEDAVEAFKHIRDKHLKPKQAKQSSLAPAARSPLQQQSANSAQKRKALPPSTSSGSAKKLSKLETVETVETTQ
eukprot:GFUD01044174.1.p1 GENE.GFUD01044174.1~~GFUD01044174.1.p1  ORF type:complete len:830 (+),score=281.23 GFUD01044174.1:100-2490(+)